MYLLLTLNIFHILHDVKYVKIRALYWKKERKVIRLTDCKLKCFPPKYKPPPKPPPRNIGPLKFAFCPYIRLGCINRILRYPRSLLLRQRLSRPVLYSVGRHLYHDCCNAEYSHPTFTYSKSTIKTLKFV